MDDPNKKQNDPMRSGGQTGQQNQQQPGQQRPGQQQQSGQQQRNNPNDFQKRPSQGGKEIDEEDQRQEQGGQRKVS